MTRGTRRIGCKVTGKKIIKRGEMLLIKLTHPVPGHPRSAPTGIRTPTSRTAGLVTRVIPIKFPPSNKLPSHMFIGSLTPLCHPL